MRGQWTGNFASKYTNNCAKFTLDSSSTTAVRPRLDFQSNAYLDFLCAMDVRRYELRRQVRVCSDAPVRCRFAATQLHFGCAHPRTMGNPFTSASVTIFTPLQLYVPQLTHVREHELINTETAGKG
jgi:hypothetical protein